MLVDLDTKDLIALADGPASRVDGFRSFLEECGAHSYDPADPAAAKASWEDAAAFLRR
jgi:hypothetical protein